MVSTYLYDIVILLLAAVVLVPLFQVARLGAVAGFLVAGIVAGPGGLGLIDNVNEIVHLAEIGVVLLLFVIGIASLIGGIVAVATAQPYAVYYPLLLIGVILAAVFGKLRGNLSARYEQLELKKMQSMDV